MRFFWVVIILLLLLGPGGCGRSSPPPPPDKEMAKFRQDQVECMRLASIVYPPRIRTNGPGVQTDLNDIPRLKAVNECLYTKGYN